MSKRVQREGSNGLIEISAYAPGNGGYLSFVARYTEDVGDKKRTQAASPSPSREECEAACPDGYEVFEAAPGVFQARSALSDDDRRRMLMLQMLEKTSWRVGRALMTFVRTPTERNSCYLTGYIGALRDVDAMSQELYSYLLALIGRIPEDEDVREMARETLNHLGYR